LLPNSDKKEKASTLHSAAKARQLKIQTRQQHGCFYVRLVQPKGVA
jgi:hypothetical protein